MIYSVVFLTYILVTYNLCNRGWYFLKYFYMQALDEEGKESEGWYRCPMRRGIVGKRKQWSWSDHEDDEEENVIVTMMIGLV